MAPLTKKQEKDQKLLHIWFSRKYWSSSCVDEAIDWNQHSDNLNIRELSEFLEWRDGVLAAARTLHKYISVEDFTKIGEVLLR